MKITSLTNPKIKDAARLRDHRSRKGSGLSIVEGLREISLAIDSKIKFKEIFICEEILSSLDDRTILTKIKSMKVPIYETTKEVFAKICYGDRNEGILGVFEIPNITLTDLRVKKDPLYLVVESVEKPGNLGAILRTCDSASVDAVIVCDEKTDIFNPNVIRASIGTIFTVQTLVCAKENVSGFLKKNKVRIFAALPQAKEPYTKCDFVGPIAIVMGSEQDGLSDFWKKNADKGVVIPMTGKADSLNVSVSTAIIVYEAVRQRKEQGKSKK